MTTNSIDPAKLSATSKKIASLVAKELPELTPHQHGAFLASTGIFLVVSYIPDLWPQFKEPAITLHQLLNQNGNARTKDNRTAEADSGHDRREAGTGASEPQANHSTDITTEDTEEQSSSV